MKRFKFISVFSLIDLLAIDGYIEFYPYLTKKGSPDPGIIEPTTAELEAGA